MQIVSPTGSLEAYREQAEQSCGITTILCHPHPQYGGSMHDAVLQTTADACLAAEVDVIRFNFRGVGESSGQFNNGIGEVDDLLAVTNWAREAHPQTSIWWMGYSFGAAVVWRALVSQTQIAPTLSILIAPPLGMMDITAAPVNTSPVFAIAGDQDTYVDTSILAGWSNVTAHTIGGADHFFSAHHKELEHQVSRILTSTQNGRCPIAP